MPFCEISFEGNPVMSSPLKTMRPPVGVSTPVRQLKKVLLPAPFGPMMAWVLPRSTAKLTCDSAARPPNRTDSMSVARIADDGAPRLGAGEPMSTAGSTRAYAAGKWQAGGNSCLSAGTVSMSLGAAFDLEDE